MKKSFVLQILTLNHFKEQPRITNDKTIFIKNSDFHATAIRQACTQEAKNKLQLLSLDTT